VTRLSSSSTEIEPSRWRRANAETSSTSVSWLIAPVASVRSRSTSSVPSSSTNHLTTALASKKTIRRGPRDPR
jgi:hypothetical protein